MDETSNKTSNKMSNEELKKRFYEKLYSYTPNWSKIVAINNETGLPDEEDYQKKLEAFKSAIRYLMKVEKLTYTEMAQRCGYGNKRQSFAKVVTQNTNPLKGTQPIKKIPVKKLSHIAATFTTSEAFLLGFTRNRNAAFTPEYYYFKENPKSEFLPIKKDVATRLEYGIETYGPSLERLIDNLMEVIKEDYELLTALNQMLRGYKKERYRQILLALSKL